MPDIGSSSFSETDASNNSASPNGAPEGMAPSGVNDTIRAVMGAIKRLFVRSVPLLTAGTSTAYTLTYTVSQTLTDGHTFRVRFHTTNGASPTLNINAGGAIPIWAYTSGAWGAVGTGALTSDAICMLSYNASSGAFFIISSSIAAVGAGGGGGGSAAQLGSANVFTALNTFQLGISVTAAATSLFQDTIRFMQNVFDTPGFGNVTNGASMQNTGDGAALFVSRAGSSAPLVLNNNIDGTKIGFYSAGVAGGSVTMTGLTVAYNTTSGREYKTDIRPIDDATEIVKGVQAYRYEWKADGTTGLGFIYDEVAPVLPQVAPFHNQVNYGGAVPVLWAALSQALERIEQLEARS